MPKYYADKDRWVKITKQYPKGFKNVLLIVEIGDMNTGEVEETAWPVDRCKLFPTLKSVQEITERDWRLTFDPTFEDVLGIEEPDVPFLFANRYCWLLAPVFIIIGIWIFT